jgi:hypothetical protein
MVLDELKQQIPLLEYLQAHDWQQAWPIGFGRLLDCARCTPTTSPAFSLTPPKTCSTATFAVAVVT